MKLTSLYQEGSSLLHRLDPMTKIMYIGAALLMTVLLSSLEASLMIAVFSLLLLFSAGVLRKTLPLIGLSSMILVTTVVIQGLFFHANETLFFKIGPLDFYREGLVFALEICIRVLNILCAFAVLVLTSKPSDLVESLVRRGLSPRLGYVLLSVLQIIPQMMGTLQTITDAQRSRGLETEGRLTVRLKAFIPLLGPVVMNALNNTKERALALEVRGFNAKHPKTFLNEQRSSRWDLPAQIAMFFSLVFAGIWRWIL